MAEPVIRRHFRCAHVIPVEGGPAWQVLLIEEAGSEFVLTVTTDDPAQARAFRPDSLFEMTITPLARPAP